MDSYPRPSNCWEFTKCGKEDTCIAAKINILDGFNAGQNGGRACYFLLGTECRGKVQTTLEDKDEVCGKCDFYLHLKRLGLLQEEPVSLAEFFLQRMSSFVKMMQYVEVDVEQ